MVIEYLLQDSCRVGRFNSRGALRQRTHCAEVFSAACASRLLRPGRPVAFLITPLDTLAYIAGIAPNFRFHQWFFWI